MSLDDFSIEFAFFISSPKDIPNRNSSAGIVSAGAKFSTGVIYALVVKNNR